MIIDGEKLVSSLIRVRRAAGPQVEKSNEYIHVFVCSQASDSSADFR